MNISFFNDVLLPINPHLHHPRELCGSLNSSFIATLVNEKGEKIHIPVVCLDNTGRGKDTHITNENHFSLSDRNYKRRGGAMLNTMERNNFKHELQNQAKLYKSFYDIPSHQQGMDSFAHQQMRLIRKNQLNETLAILEEKLKESKSEYPKRPSEKVLIPLHLVNNVCKSQSADNLDKLLECSLKWYDLDPKANLLFPCLSPVAYMSLKDIFTLIFPNRMQIITSYPLRKDCPSYSANDNNNSTTRKPPQSDNIVELVVRLKEMRTSFCMSQAEICLLLQYFFNLNVSQPIYSRFETWHLQTYTMLLLKPHIERFIEKGESLGPVAMTAHLIKAERRLKDSGTCYNPQENEENSMLDITNTRLGEGHNLLTQRRMKFSFQQKEALRSFFLSNPKPKPFELMNLSKELDLEYYKVKTWFSNKRLRVKKNQE